MKSLFKRLNVSGHFEDFKHHAESHRNNKRLRSRKERRKLNEHQKDMVSSESRAQGEMEEKIRPCAKKKDENV